MINVPHESLDLNYIFGDYLAEYIKESAKEIPTNPDAIVTILLPVLASVIGTRSRIIVNPNTRYIVPFIIRSMIFAYIVTKCQEGMLNSQLLKIFELLKKKVRLLARM